MHLCLCATLIKLPQYCPHLPQNTIPILLRKFKFLIKEVKKKSPVIQIRIPLKILPFAAPLKKLLLCPLSPPVINIWFKLKSVKEIRLTLLK